MGYTNHSVALCKNFKHSRKEIIEHIEILEQRDLEREKQIKLLIDKLGV